MSDFTPSELTEEAFRKSRLRLEAALSSMTDAVFITDADGRFVDFNDTFATFHRFKDKSECPKSIAEYPELLEMLMPDGALVPLDMWLVPRALRGDVAADIEYIVRRKDTGETWAGSYSFAPIRDESGAIVGSLVSGRDISERRPVLEARHTREILEQALDSAVRANESKSRFLNAASHDLRQPLQAIGLLNATLRRFVTDPNAIEVLSQQDQAIDAMSRLLNALLDISKLESGAVNPKPTDFMLGDVLDELRTEYAGQAAERRLRLEIEAADHAVYSDPSLVGLILRNLLSNALKYTHEGSVRLRCLREAARIRVDVIDTGVGIPADELPHIYDDFYQVGVPANSKRDGYGLGLSIVKHLVKLLSLKLDVRSEAGRGSTFSLLVPASSAQVLTVRRTLTLSSASRPLQIREPAVLLVEDDSSVQRAMYRLLSLEGYRVTSVASLSEALQHIEKGNRVDLLICDYHLSDESGLQVIAALRDLLGASLPALLISGDTSSVIKQPSGDRYLRFTIKPVQADDLLKLLRELLAT